jgi:gliding motility-associated lipoprotein GldD
MELKMKANLKISIIVIFSLTLASCGGGEEYYSPKPRGYFRIDLPQKEYVAMDTLFPFTFQIPVYSSIEYDTAAIKGEHWFNLVLPALKGKLHFSYKQINNNLYDYTEDSYTFVYKHVPKAEDITAQEFSFPDRNVFAVVYYIDGVQAASPLQFYITDSTSHFLRGALYFNHLPNNDSIQPVIDFVNEDVLHIISTLKWK